DVIVSSQFGVVGILQIMSRMKTAAVKGAMMWLVCIVATVVAASAPPKRPPEALVGGYTLNQQVPMEFFYVDDTAEGQGTHFEYSAAAVVKMVRSANSTRQ